MKTSTPLKPLSEQTIVITGATSGIGLATAREAAAQGARLVLAARSADDLNALQQELSGKGAQVAVVPADVGSSEDVRRIAEVALAKFQSFDTWVNNAGVSVYGRLDEISEQDHRRLFETDFWGIVNGSLTALKHLKQQGGAIINIGSVASDQAFPLQGMYCASKHAVKGFTNALRMEIEHYGAPISVTLIKPGSIDTPFTENARNYMEQESRLPPPVYEPKEVAEAILHAATHQRREIYVGGASKFVSAARKLLPGLVEKVAGALMAEQQKRPEPARDAEGTLHQGGSGLREKGGHPGYVMSSSLYTRASLHPWLTSAVLGAAGIALASMLGSGSRTRHLSHRI